ncbi:MAG TPA: protoporphyrinogen oxidase, partial [Vicinamibacteria bacterium]|nr:protoporphyrinogen oxidase [Vicinamibacteria bacterium]
GLGSELIPTNPERRRVYVLHGGRLHALPDGFRLTVPTRILPFLGSRLFSVRAKLRMLCEPFVPGRRAAGDESVAAFVRRRFGEEALELAGEPLLAGIHCGDAEKLSMECLFPNLAALERRYGSLTRGMISERRGEETVFLSLSGGMSRLVEKLAQEIRGEIRLNQRAVGIRRNDGGFEIALASGERVPASALVLALPLRVSEDLLEGIAPLAAIELSRIQTVSTAVVFHAFRRERVNHPLDGYGFVVPASEPNRLLAATFVSTKFPTRAPPSYVLVRTFLGGRREPGILNASDAEIETTSRGELERVLGSLGVPIFSRVVRWADRTPQVEVGHRSRIDAFERALADVPGLFVLGSGLRGVGIPDSIAAARALAAEL